MINEKVKNILNEQINKEFYSAYLYLAMSAYFDDIGLYGFANWTKVQAREEVDHGMIIFNYLIDRNCKVQLLQIDYPDSDFTSPLQVFEKILEHENLLDILLFQMENQICLTDLTQMHQFFQAIYLLNH